MKTLRRWCGNGLFVLCTVLACAGLGELALRAFDVQFDAALNTPDRDRGWGFRPHAKGWFIQEGRDYVRINSDGLRDREHAVAKPPGTLRVAVVGDSFSAALQLPMEKTYWALLEGGLASCAGQPVEVINFGVGGYSTANELMTLRKQVWKYQPDIVLLQVYLGNDVVDNSRKLGEDKNPNGPFFEYAGDELVLDAAFRRRPNFQPAAIDRHNLITDVANTSRLLLGIYDASLGVLGRKGRFKSAGDGPLATLISPREQLVYAPPATPAFAEAWRITEGTLRQFHAEVTAGGAKMWMTSLSTPAQVWPDKAAREAFAASLHVPDLSYADDRLEAFAAREGIRHVGLARPMAQHADETGDVLHGFVQSFYGLGHWNEIGHRVGAKILTARMCADDLGADAVAPQQQTPRR